MPGDDSDHGDDILPSALDTDMPTEPLDFLTENMWKDAIAFKRDRESKFIKDMKAYCRISGNHWTPVHRERNVYKIRMRVPGCDDSIYHDMSSPSDIDLEPIDGDAEMSQEPLFQRHPREE